MGKRLIAALMITFLFTGCSQMIGKEVLNETINQLEDYLNQEQWDILQERALELEKEYEKQQWKLQLLGDEGEYESLKESIHRFIQAVEQEDKTQAKLELATIKTIIEEIYTL